jgi:DNA repair protein RadC
MSIKDAGAFYSANNELGLFGNLIGEVLGCPSAGQKVLEALLLPNEQPTEANVRDRLRKLLQSGHISGLTENRMQRLQATLELGKRLYLGEPQKGEIVDDPHLAAKAFQAIAWGDVEQFAVLVMNIKHRLLSTIIISSGSATETCAHPREIFGAVIRAGGSRCIIAHNHPSGSTAPSPEDMALTRQLLQAAKVMDIPILDHLVLAGSSYTSLRQTTTLWDSIKNP